MTDPSAEPAPDAGDVRDLLDDSAAADVAETAASSGRDGSTMDRTCHACGRALRPQTGIVGGQGFQATVGVCPVCRVEGVGGAAFVTVTDQPVPAPTRKGLLSSRQSNAQSAHTAAGYLLDAPPGDYVVRRVAPAELAVRPQDADDWARSDWQAVADLFHSAGLWQVQIDQSRGKITLCDPMGAR